MLRKMLQDDAGFINNDRVKGALFKADIREISDSAFSKRGINKLISHLDIVFDWITYAKPRMDTPCMYGMCNILNDCIPVESQLAWADLKRIKREEGGVFFIYIEVDNDTSYLSRVKIGWDVENVNIGSIKMSPVLKML